MKGIYQVYARGFLTILVSVFMMSCATIPVLKVHYQLPPASDQLKGKRIVLAFEDARGTQEIFGQGAQKEFGNFSGNLSFSIARHREPGFKIGIFQISGIMREAFKRRLETLGMEVLLEPSHGEPQLLIVLNEFLLDLVDRKWMARMDYEARLIKNGRVLSTQTISGEAERYKLVGRGEADKAMGEIFTDMVNRLNVPRLFQQAGLEVASYGLFECICT